MGSLQLDQNFQFQRNLPAMSPSLGTQISRGFTMRLPHFVVIPNSLLRRVFPSLIFYSTTSNNSSNSTKANTSLLPAQLHLRNIRDLLKLDLIGRSG